MSWFRARGYESKAPPWATMLNRLPERYRVPVGTVGFCLFTFFLFEAVNPLKPRGIPKHHTPEGQKREMEELKRREYEAGRMRYKPITPNED